MGRLRRIEEISEVGEFDCGDAALNAFLKEDACHFKSEMIANTFVLQEDEKIVAYFSLFNDIVSRDTADRNLWRKVRGLFPHAKHFSSYPAVKIGRLEGNEKQRRRQQADKSDQADGDIKSADVRSTFPDRRRIYAGGTLL